MAQTAINYYFLWKTKTCLQPKHKLELANLNCPTSGNCPRYKIFQQLQQFQWQHQINAWTAWLDVWLYPHCICNQQHSYNSPTPPKSPIKASMKLELEICLHREHFGSGKIWTNLPNKPSNKPIPVSWKEKTVVFGLCWNFFTPVSTASREIRNPLCVSSLSPDLIWKGLAKSYLI